MLSKNLLVFTRVCRAGLAIDDFGSIGTDDEAKFEVVACPRNPIGTSLHCLFTGNIDIKAKKNI